MDYHAQYANLASSRASSLYRNVHLSYRGNTSLPSFRASFGRIIDRGNRVARESVTEPVCSRGRDLEESRRDRALETMFLPGGGMGEGKDLGVQGHALDGVGECPIFFVANNRVPHFLHVYPDLVFPAGIEVDLQ